MFARKEYEDAKRFLISSLEQNQDTETQNLLALTYYELEEYQSAINIFENLIKKHPENVLILKNLSKCYEKLKDNDKALEYLYKLTNIFPEDEESQ